MVNILFTAQVIGTVLMFVYIIYVLSTRKAGEYSVLTAALASAFLNCFAYTVLLFSDSAEAAMAVKPFDIMGSSLTFYLLYKFIRESQKVKIPRIVSLLLLAADMFGIFSAVSDRKFHLYYKSVNVVENAGFFSADVSCSVGFYVLLGSMIIKTALIILIAADGCFRRSGDGSPGSQTSLWTFFTVILPMLSMAAYNIQLFGYFNPSSLMVCLSCSAITAAVRRGNKSEMVNTARDSVIETMRDALIITDGKMNIVDSNLAARRIFPEISAGKKEAAALAERLVAGGSEDGDEFEIDGKYYEKHVNRLLGADGTGKGCSVLIIDVTDTKKYVDRLIEMSRRADMANSAKSDFLANMSHEIRTPMNAITGFAELCLQEKNYTYAADIKTAAKNLISIINDILDISKIEAGKLELVPAVYDTEAMLEDVISIIYVQLGKKKNIEFKTDIDRRLPKKMYGDEVRLKQILINLLNNAVKFTNKGSISLSVKQLDRSGEDISLMLRVADTGIGIKNEDMPKLFGNFQQVDTRKNRKIEGSGLGLSISKTLAEKMNGSITVDSEYGKGSVFTVIVVQKISDPSPISKSTAKAAVSEESGLSVYAPDAHVLVVDDNKVNLDVTARLLSTYGIKADLADSGQKAIKMVNSSYYDLVFMDHMMPDMDGVDTTKIIRSQGDAYSRELPIVALTANAVSGAREMFLESGFNDFISKPIQMPLLEKILETWLPEKMIKHIERDKKTNNGSTFFDIIGYGTEKKAENSEPEEDIIIPNVDVTAGLQTCGGSPEAYLAVMKTFYETSSESISRIENYAQSRDYKNYTTEVHGLKSSSLSIGALGLSEMARCLEEAGKAENYKQIQADTPALIARFSEIAENIKSFVEADGSQENEAEKPPADENAVREKIGELLEALDELDSHRATQIFDEFGKYRYSSGEISECIKAGRKYAENFAYEKAEVSARRIMEIIDNKLVR